jgi:hypothetical protein
VLALESDTVLALEQGIVLHSLPDQDHFFAFSVITGDEFRLNQTSFWVLEAIGDGIKWSELKSSFLKTFEVVPVRGESDLRALIEQFYNEKIIRRRDNGN